MAKEQQQTDLTPDEVSDRIWELAKKIDICMFTTWDGKSQWARPLSARVHRDEETIYFLVDAKGAKNKQIKAFPIVTLAWTDNSAHKYVTISGTASLGNDWKKIKSLWEKTDKAWWDDENDPSIRVITVKPVDGELWDGPTGVVATAKMVVAALTGAKLDFGDNAKVKL